MSAVLQNFTQTRQPITYVYYEYKYFLIRYLIIRKDHRRSQASQRRILYQFRLRIE